MEMEVVALPDDVLTDVLRRVPQRSLAAARCVCKAWRAIVDARGLLLPHLLPHSVRGIFVNYNMHYNRPHLFVRPSTPSTIPRIDGMLGFLPNDHKWDRWSVLDHCNGLLLCEIDFGGQLCVCNPATQRWALLPHRAEAIPPTVWWDMLSHNARRYLVFDPAMSPHYEVFLIPPVPEKPKPPLRREVEEKRRALPRQQEMVAPFCLEWLFSSSDGALMAEDTEEEEEERQQPVESTQPPPAPWHLMEWPPSPFRLIVFSSRTGRWEERTFVREGEPAGTVADLRLDQRKPTKDLRALSRYYRQIEITFYRQLCAVYWKGKLYVHCRGDFVMRFSLSNDKYQVIKMPANSEKYMCPKPYLGRSEKGVYFGTIHDCRLKVWILSESCGQMEWVLKHQNDLRPIAQQVESLRKCGPWIVEEDNIDVHDNAGALSEDNFEWDSDNDDFLATEGGFEMYDGIHFAILGFQPYKEVVFLTTLFGTVAYHLNNSRIQYLGNLRPRYYYPRPAKGIYESFVYTPCMIGELNGGRFGTNSED